jgi:hypothetical protein
LALGLGWALGLWGFGALGFWALALALALAFGFGFWLLAFGRFAIGFFSYHTLASAIKRNISRGTSREEHLLRKPKTVK